jgi:hypothetical protein
MFSGSLRSRAIFRAKLACIAALVMLAACGSSSPEQDAGGDAAGSPATDAAASEQIDSAAWAGGTVWYSLEDGIRRIEARPGSQPQNISDLLDDVAGTGSDGWVNASSDGHMLLVETDRLGCADWPCLAVVDMDTRDAVRVEADGEAVHAENFGAISPDGRTVVYPQDGGPHELDLWAVTRDGAGWSSPRLLTDGSDSAWHELPAFSADGAYVLFNCSDTAYAQEGAALCEVGADGGDLRRVLGPTDIPGGGPQESLHHPAYAPDGSIVFEANGGDVEMIWRLPAGSARAEPITTAFSNDNSPCVLPDGAIVSLWLDREGGNGDHELKVMRPDGSEYAVLLPDVDVADVGIGCSA